MNLKRYLIYFFFLLAPFVLTNHSAANQNLGKLLRLSNPHELAAWATRFEHGEGVNQSTYNAVMLYCKAARKGHADSQYSLGWLYANGRGVSRDDALAAAWFRLAARQGNPQAKRMLALVDNPKQKRRASCELPLVEGDALALAGGVSREQRRRIAAWVEQIAPQYELDPKLVLAVIETESGFRIRARSVKNAQGLMQLIPATASRFGVQNSMDPVQNLHGGMAYLRWLLAYFQGDLTLALAGYNAGEGAVEKYNGIPPYRETQRYVKRIIKRYGKDYHPAVTQVVAPSPQLAAAP